MWDTYTHTSIHPERERGGGREHTQISNRKMALQMLQSCSQLPILSLLDYCIHFMISSVCYAVRKGHLSQNSMQRNLGSSFTLLIEGRAGWGKMHLALQSTWSSQKLQRVCLINFLNRCASPYFFSAECTLVPCVWAKLSALKENGYTVSRTWTINAI